MLFLSAIFLINMKLYLSCRGCSLWLFLHDAPWASLPSAFCSSLMSRGHCSHSNGGETVASVSPTPNCSPDAGGCCSYKFRALLDRGLQIPSDVQLQLCWNQQPKMHKWLLGASVKDVHSASVCNILKVKMTQKCFSTSETFMMG